MGIEFEILYALQKLHTDWLDAALEAVTSLGNAGWFWICLGILLMCIPRTRRTGCMVMASLALGALIGNVALKNLVARPRPCWIDQSVALLIANPTDYSFPSGHTLASFEAAVTIFLQDRRWGTAALILAALIGFSRLYFFVHFPTDVLAGAALGTAVAWFVRWMWRRVGKDKGTDGSLEGFLD